MTADMEQNTSLWLNGQAQNADSYSSNYDKYIRSQLTSQTNTLHFPQELINRLDTIVPFNSLSVDTLSAIANEKLADLQHMTKVAHHIDLHIADEVVPFLIKQISTNGNTEDDGLAIKRQIDSEIMTKVARMVFEHPDYHSLEVVVAGNDNDQRIMVTSDNE